MSIRPDSLCDSFTKYPTKTINICGIQVVNFILFGILGSWEHLRFKPKIEDRRRGERRVIIFLYNWGWRAGECAVCSALISFFLYRPRVQWALAYLPINRSAVVAEFYCTRRWWWKYYDKAKVRVRHIILLNYSFLRINWSKWTLL